LKGKKANEYLLSVKMSLPVHSLPNSLAAGLLNI
jgi:hypothetical protein